MKLIVDGGATKADWYFYNSSKNEGQVYKTTGFSPYFMTTSEISNMLTKELEPYLDNQQIKDVHYYGTGCSSESKVLVVEEALKAVFPNASCNVYHDLLAAAHSLLGKNEGIACILGTGSNTCLYNGNEIVDELFSLGYLLGDEGSGACLGKKIISAYLHNELPKELETKLKEYYPHSRHDILDNVYTKPNPNRFLASFAYFLNLNKEHEFIRNILTNAFNDFFKYQIFIYPEYKKYTVNFTGSVAFHFQDVIKDVANSLDIKINKIEQSPLQGLVDYHLGNGK